MNDNKDHILEKGYRPTSRLNTMDPPRSGSAVPSRVSHPATLIQYSKNQRIKFGNIDVTS